LRPSGADDSLTDKIVKAGKLLDIRVNDHIIVTSGGYYSYVDENRL
jgi:DNA repair protein RadC